MLIVCAVRDRDLVVFDLLVLAAELVLIPFVLTRLLFFVRLRDVRLFVEEHLHVLLLLVFVVFVYLDNGVVLVVFVSDRSLQSQLSSSSSSIIHLH